MKKFVVLLLIFCIGFFTHAMFFPDLFINKPISTANINNENETQNTEVDELIKNKYTTIVTYKNRKFSQKLAYIQKGSYLSVRNDDKNELMWLESEESTFNTIRGYGLSEAIKIRLDKPKTFKIIEKSSQANLTVVVK